MGKKTKPVLEIFQKGIENLSDNILMSLYKSMVQPCLEHCTVLVMTSQKGYSKLAKVLFGATRVVRGLGDTIYNFFKKKKGN